MLAPKTPRRLRCPTRDSAARPAEASARHTAVRGEHRVPRLCPTRHDAGAEDAAAPAMSDARLRRARRCGATAQFGQRVSDSAKNGAQALRAAAAGIRHGCSASA